MEFQPHTSAWYDRLAQLQEGYYYPWKSQLAPFNGEDTYFDLVKATLSSTADVLEIGCGHGKDALELAPFCHSIFGYDRVASYIELAQKAAEKSGLTNVTFYCADSSVTANNNHSRIPAPYDHAFDLLISRRGPLHWIEDARRVARPGAILLELCVMETPSAPWDYLLPACFQSKKNMGSIREAVERRLQAANIALHSCWTFDVPEIFPDVEQLYRFLSFGYTIEEVPPFEEMRPTLEHIFSHYAGPQGLERRFGRLLWKAVV